VLLSCRKPAPPPLTVVMEPKPPIPVGAIEGGRFLDRERGFSIAVPEDWQIEPGAMGEDLRVTLTHVVTQTMLEISVHPERTVEPRERDFCLWTYQDEGKYTTLNVGRPVTVAGCTPWDPTESRAQGWYTVTPEWAYHLELILGDGYLAPGLDVGEALIYTFRLE